MSSAPIPTEPGYIWGGARAPGRRRVAPPRAGAPPTARPRRLGSGVLTLGAARPESRPYESWHFENPARPARPRLPRHAGRLGRPVPGDDVRPRRAVVARPRSLAAGGPGVRRRRASPSGSSTTAARSATARVARHADREHRRAGARGRQRRASSDLVDRGLADPERAVVGGHSWGGYVTLLELGKHPDLWRCGIAGVPVGDYEAGYERALAAPPGVRQRASRRRDAEGATRPHARPQRDQLRRRRARARSLPHRTKRQPLPVRARRWHTSTGLLRATIPHEVYVFETGHGSFDVDERVRQVGIDPRLPRRPRRPASASPVGPTTQRGIAADPRELLAFEKLERCAPAGRHPARRDPRGRAPRSPARSRRRRRRVNASAPATA